MVHISPVSDSLFNGYKGIVLNSFIKTLGPFIPGKIRRVLHKTRLK